MSRKKNKNNTKLSSKPKEKRDEEFSPFSSIVLKEKKEEPKKSTSPSKKSAPSGKRPQQIVQGYDPKASFSDILYNWEHTGELYAMPKPKASLAGAKSDSKQSFGDILDAWEKKSTPKAPQKGPVKRVSPEYKATKDFGAILDQYEGRAPSRPEIKISDPASEKPVTTKSVEKEEVNKPLNPFFREKEEDDERPDAVAWSIFGDNRKREVKAATQTEEVSEKPIEAKSYKRTSAEYRPTEDFGAILEKYEGASAIKAKAETVKETPAAVNSERKEEKPEVTTFFKSYADEERPAAVAWSVLGGNVSVSRQVEKQDEPVSLKAEEKPLPLHKEEVKTSPLFQKSISTIDVKTFDDILREKGDTERLRREKSINEIRMMLPQATLDLHGMTQAEAESAVTSFLDEAAGNALEKVSIIHGKGLHAEDGQGVLKELTYRLCSNSELIREYTVPKAQYGGSGALWIILKRKKSDDAE